MITCLSILCFAGISLVLFYCDFIGSEQHFLAEKIEHLSPLYAVLYIQYHSITMFNFCNVQGVDTDATVLCSPPNCIHCIHGHSGLVGWMLMHTDV